MTVPAFSPADLAETAAKIRQRLDGDAETLELLQQLLDMTEQTNEQWDERLAELQQGQSDIAKAIVMLARQNRSLGKRMDTITKGLAATFNLVKGRSTIVNKSQSFNKSLPTASATKQAGGMSLAAAQRLGTLAKTIQTTFGGNGGHSMPYNASLASKMILEGSLSPKQHQTWKRSNRLHDDPYQALQRRKVG